MIACLEALFFLSKLATKSWCLKLNHLGINWHSSISQLRHKLEEIILNFFQDTGSAWMNFLFSLINYLEPGMQWEGVSAILKKRMTYSYLVTCSTDAVVTGFHQLLDCAHNGFFLWQWITCSLLQWLLGRWGLLNSCSRMWRSTWRRWNLHHEWILWDRKVIHNNIWKWNWKKTS